MGVDNLARNIANYLAFALGVEIKTQQAYLITSYIMHSTCHLFLLGHSDRMGLDNMARSIANYLKGMG